MVELENNVDISILIVLFAIKDWNKCVMVHNRKRPTEKYVGTESTVI
jgi:hypothetical protein